MAMNRKRTLLSGALRRVLGDPVEHLTDVV